MTTLTNPVSAQNIVDRFSDYVIAQAHDGITWGTDNKPFAEFNAANFGGDTNGKPISISGGNLSSHVSASNIYSVLVGELQRQTGQRTMRALRYMQGDNGASTLDYDGTAKAHMSDWFLQDIAAAGGVPTVGLGAGQPISSANLESTLANMRQVYLNLAVNTVTITTTVCHSSCHNSCHSSRGRR